jgi:hypothetical protein
MMERAASTEQLKRATALIRRSKKGWDDGPILTELELAAMFVVVARLTRDPKTRARSLHDARAAYEVVKRMFAQGGQCSEQERPRIERLMVAVGRSLEQAA